MCGKIQCHIQQENQDEDQETKDESGRSNPARRTRAAAVHNQSERVWKKKNQKKEKKKNNFRNICNV